MSLTGLIAGWTSLSQKKKKNFTWSGQQGLAAPEDTNPYCVAASRLHKDRQIRHAGVSIFQLNIKEWRATVWIIDSKCALWWQPTPGQINLFTTPRKKSRRYSSQQSYSLNTISTTARSGGHLTTQLLNCSSTFFIVNFTGIDRESYCRCNLCQSRWNGTTCFLLYLSTCVSPSQSVVSALF